MNTATALDGQDLKRALTAGALAVIQQQDHLNKINVFPVPDGDTGTNLAYTLSAIVQRLKSVRDNHAGNVLTIVADAALDGARGNSGAIMAQFFQGLSDSAANVQRLTIKQFSAAATLGARYARDALSEPREGTLVTVLRDFAHEIAKQVKDHTPSSFLNLLQQGLRKAITSVRNTPNLLDTLKKAGVVDAGGQGFVDLLQGMVNYMTTGRMPEVDHAIETQEAEVGEYGETGQYQFCTECLVEADSVDHRLLKEALSGIGDSLVVAGRRNKVKIHMHVNEPAELFKIASGFGQVSGQKADDMWAQSKATHHDNLQKVAVVTDSAADLPDDEFDGYNGYMVPLRVHFGDVSHLDKVGISQREFFDQLQTSEHHPTTSQPAPGDFRRLYAYLISHFDSVISLHLTSHNSGTCQSAASAAERTDKDRVCVIDSKSVSVGLGLLVKHAGDLAVAGKTLKEIKSAVEGLVEKTTVFIVLDDLKFAVRGGRVPPLVQKIADFLRLRPVLSITKQGKVKPAGALFGRSDRENKLVKHVMSKTQFGKTYRFAVGHTNAEAAGKKVYDSLREQIPSVDYSFFDATGAALGAHAGPGGLVVALQEID